MTPDDLSALKREARKKGTSAARLLEIAALGPELSREIALSDNTPPEILAQLATTEDRGTVQRVAANPHTPPETLAALAHHADLATVRNVAVNKATPAATRQALAPQAQPGISLDRLTLTPPDLLDMVRGESSLSAVMGDKVLAAYGDPLSFHLEFPDSELLKAIALSDLIPAGAARRLAQHPNPEIREALAQNVDKIAPSVRAQIQKGATHDEP